jgi:hypothetical protein
VWTLAGEAVDAMDIPEDLGQRTMSTLRGQGRPHSVIAVPGAAPALRFLVQPSNATPRGMLARLTRHGGVYLDQATIIELPPTRVPGGELSWLRGPVSTLPSLGQMIATFPPDQREQHKSGDD